MSRKSSSHTDAEGAAPGSSKGRGRRPKPDEQRKARVIQTRVPEDLESTLKQAAESRRMTVSHLIRNVLEDTFTLVDNIVADSSALVEQVSRDAKKVASSVRGEADYHSKVDTAARIDDVDSWQDVILNKTAKCTQCGVQLSRGKRAYRGISTEEISQPVWLCESCIEDL